MRCTKNLSAERDVAEEQSGDGRTMSTMIRARNRKMPIRRITDRNGCKDCVAKWWRSGDRRPFKEFEHCVYHAADVCECMYVHRTSARPHQSSISVCTAATQHYVCTPRPSLPRVTRSLFSPLPPRLLLFLLQRCARVSPAYISVQMPNNRLSARVALYFW